MWLCTVISVEIGKGGSEFRDVLQFFDKLNLARSERCSGALLVDVRVATVAWLLAVAVAKFAMASTVSCW